MIFGLKRVEKVEEIMGPLQNNMIVLKEASCIGVPPPTILRLLYKVYIHRIQFKHSQHLRMSLLYPIEGINIVWSFINFLFNSSDQTSTKQESTLDSSDRKRCNPYDLIENFCRYVSYKLTNSHADLADVVIITILKSHPAPIADSAYHRHRNSDIVYSVPGIQQYFTIEKLSFGWYRMS